jgi:Putative MetA-pathway of phenol degradation
MRRILGIAPVFAICLAASMQPLKAQYLGDQIIGLAGLQAGTQPGPGIYFTIPLYFRYSGISIYDPQGNQVFKNVTNDINLFVLPAVAVVTPFKIFGANYGAAYTEWVSNGVVNIAAINFQRSTKYAFGDLYVQPVILGWHLQHADITAGYAFFAPTGATGQHMWVNEIDLGATFYPDAAKKWNVATMMFYDFNQTKNNTNITVGDLLTLGGGVGRSFLKGAANAGVAYGAQWKMTHDHGPDIPAVVSITNGRVFAVGPEIDLPVFAKGQNLGLVSFRYLWPIGPKTTLSGQTLVASFTFARLRKQ